jgi:putative tryptophan/tyrosine transport system substrate-binding protein
MNRRAFITLLGGAAAWPLSARAQEGKRLQRVGVLASFPEGDPELQSRLAAFRDTLHRQGWRIGSNLQIDYRWDISTDERARAATTELINLQPNLIFANAAVALRAAQHATHTIPIVFTMIADPVGQGFIDNLPHPGGNTTGFSSFDLSVGGKWLDLLKDIAPSVTRVAFIFNPQRGPYSVAISSFVEKAAEKHAMQYVATPVLDPADIEPVMSTLAREPGGALIVSPDQFTATHRRLIVDSANNYGLPAMYGVRDFIADGGLASYGTDFVDQFRQAASYVDRILRGENPAGLPVQQPIKFEFVINLRTAKALGIGVPNSIQLLADEVIE